MHAGIEQCNMLPVLNWLLFHAAIGVDLGERGVVVAKGVVARELRKLAAHLGLEDFI